MADVFKIADFFIETAGEESDMTNLKLNKMLFFAQGVHLARTGKPLFDNPILAWKLGPVVFEIYQKYKHCQKFPIEAMNVDIDNVFNEAEQNTLLDVLREYGKYSASYLVDKTHRPGSPWYNTLEEDRISFDVMRDYFLNHEVVRSFADILKESQIPVVTGYRDKDGVLILPNDEDDDWGEYNEV